MELDSNCHSVFLLYYHLVLVVKYRRNVFDNMVRALSEAVMKDEITKDQFINESSRLDVDKVVSCTRCMYTLLEVVSTIQLEKVDDQYIQDTLNSIKK